MTFRESPITLLAIALLVVMKACTQSGEITATEDSSMNDASTEVETNSNSTMTNETPFILELKNSEGEQVNKWLYGYNTANLFFHLSKEEEGVNMIEELYPNILRFPGGTSANFYHFNGPGYGLELSDAETVAKFNAYKNTKSSAMKEKEAVAKGSLEDNHARLMVDLCKKTGSSVLLVTNHFTANEEENMAMIDFFVQSEVDIVGIELGNEYYLKTYEDKFPDVDSYINEVKSFAKNLKAKYPDIPLAVVAAPNDEMKSMNAKRAVETGAWNSRLAQEDFYDAYVVHNYAKNKNCDQKAMLPQIVDCYSKYNLELVKSTLPNGIEAYDQIYAPRKMWLTEWNVKEVFKGLGNTMLQATYMAEHLMMLSDQDKVELATYHNLLAAGDGFNIITTNGKGRYAETAAYQTAVLLNPIFSGNMEHQAFQTVQKGENRMMSVKAFQNATHSYLVVVNQSPVNERIGLNLENRENPKAEIKGFSAGSLLADRSQLKSYDKPCPDIQSIDIPAFSINLIKLQK